MKAKAKAAVKPTIVDDADVDEAINMLPGESGETLRGLFHDITNPKKRRWLAAIARCGRIVESQRLSGINWRFHYFWLEKDTEGIYRAAYEKARSIACDWAEDQVFQRAFAGIDRPLHFKGKLTGHAIKEYSDLLSIFWLKGARPDKYREDSRVQINLNVPPAVNIIPAIDVTDESEEA